MIRVLSPRAVQAVGAAALLLGLALPWTVYVTWLRQQRREPVRSAWRPEMVELPPGDFQMGSTPEEGPFGDERLHPVRITRPFALARTEVTQVQYRAVVGKDPSHFTGDDRPVESVSWEDAIAYCNALSRREGIEECYEGERWKEGCQGYRLPTEAEWEYAARAGTRTRYAGGDDADAVAWHNGNAGNETHTVGKRKPNRWGLYDMSGNVYEWVWDFYDENYGKEISDPRGPVAGPGRVNRGGSFDGPARYVRVANRDVDPPGDRWSILGFRVARSLP